MNSEVKGGIIVVGLIVVGVIFAAWALPTYSVWRQGKVGLAELRRAEQSKLIQIEQARAELEASKLRAQAIEIEGIMAAKYPEYRTQQFIGAFAQAMESGRINQIIYVPTEAGIPILESQRLKVEAQ